MALPWAHDHSQYLHAFYLVMSDEPQWLMEPFLYRSGSDAFVSLWSELGSYNKAVLAYKALGVLSRYERAKIRKMCKIEAFKAKLLR